MAHFLPVPGESRRKRRMFNVIKGLRILSHPVLENFANSLLYFFKYPNFYLGKPIIENPSSTGPCEWLYPTNLALRRGPFKGVGPF